MASRTLDQPQEYLEAWNGRFTGRSIAKRLGRHRAARSQYLDPAGGSLFQKSLMSFSVNFDAPVVVTGQPSIPLLLGASERSATYASGTGTSSLTFSYVVKAGDQAERSEVSVGELLNIDNANSIKYIANDETIARTNLAIQGNPGDLVVDAVAPRIEQ